MEEPIITSSLTLAMTPRGHLRLEAGESVIDLPDPVRRRVEAAFAGGVGAGLLHLAVREQETELDPSLRFGRGLARAYVEALCRQDEDAADEPVEPRPDVIASLLEVVPPMRGAEYINAEALVAAWSAIDAEARARRADHGAGLQEFVHALNPAWNSLGRVTFHLAEQKNDAERPFAFLATYAERMTDQGRVRHVPLGRALDRYRGDQPTLLKLLRPVDEAARRDPFIRELADGGGVFRPLAWTPQEASRFLAAVPRCIESGLVVRLPDWWKPKQRRPMVTATVGGRPPSALGVDAMLDFDVAITIDGKELSPEERRDLLEGAPGLRLLKGRWVEVDPERLREAVLHFEAVAADARAGGISFFEGMRLLSGLSTGVTGGAVLDDAIDPSWAGVVSGPWLEEVLARLSRPEDEPDDFGGRLVATLRPYQRRGVSWLQRIATLGLGGCLADDMGLGKTIQVIALFLRLAEDGFRGPHLLVVPASLLGNWRHEIERFAPSLRLAILHRSELGKEEIAAFAASKLDDVDVVMTTYGSVARLEWLAKRKFGLVVLDEAQAIKNPGTRQSRAVKKLDGRARFALTGTPVENRLGDLWSIFDFLCPGLLGSARAFGNLAKRLEGGGGYGPLRRVVAPYILRRLKTDRNVIDDLPDKTEVDVFCGLTKVQAALYQRSVAELARTLEDVDGMARRGAVLAFLLRFKQICNHPSQWLGDGEYEPEKSAKFARLRELCEPLIERQEKVLVFTQFREMTGPLSNFLASVFGRPGLVIHGGTPVKRRSELVAQFQTEDGPPHFVLSLKAGGTGLNLTEASHVVHFDRWWNPAVENQATDRAFRIGQKRNVLVHKFVVRGTVEERIAAMLEQKQALADEVVSSGGGEMMLTEMGSKELVELVSLDLDRAMA